jgi:hypothetical protein
MPNYSISKIYKIKSENTDEVYIGSTTKKTINDRYSQHKWAYKQYKSGFENECNYSSRAILEKGDCSIELLEEYPCDNEYQLKKREYYLIDNTPNTINKIKNPYILNLTENEYFEMKAKKKEKKIHRDCECGGRYLNTPQDINRHHATNKHQKYLDFIHDKLNH